MRDVAEGRRLRSRLLVRLRAGGDEGFSMLLAIGLTAAVAALMTLSAAAGISALRSASDHASYEGALAASEAGIDATLSAVAAAYNSTPSVDYANPAGCTVAAPSVAQTATADAERTWARDALLALPQSCTRSTGAAEYVAVRAPGRQAVYAMGWHPTRTSPRAERRLLKAEYLFAPFKPANAILTQGNLDFGGSVAVNATASGGTAPVHTNGSVVAYNSSLAVQGPLSASGALPGSCPAGVTGGCTAAAPLQALPVISARNVYVQESQAYAGAWYDLCPDGTVRPPSATGVPCSSATVLPSTRGWQFTAGNATTAPVWTLPRNAGGPYAGIYYVFQGDARIGDNGNSSTTWMITVLAEARTGVTNATTCNKLGGNITWRLFNLAPRMPGLQLLADANLLGGANADAGSGLFLAGDKVDLATSSSTLTGSVVAGNGCPAQGANRIQGVTVRYDDSVESPLKDVIRTSLWLEYAAG